MFEFECDAAAPPPPESPRGDALGFLSVVAVTVLAYLVGCLLLVALHYTTL